MPQLQRPRSTASPPRVRARGSRPKRCCPAPISLAPATSSAVSHATSISPLSGRPNLRRARLKISRRSRLVQFGPAGHRRALHPEGAPQARPRHGVWDGSRAAARAIADAMPLLERAKIIEVVIIVADERDKQYEIEGVDMGQHLARHGLKVDVKRIDYGNLDVADALLSHAADYDADFIVMGGYGHSRLREFVLGGVTRSILRTMTAPVLMSH